MRLVILGSGTGGSNIPEVANRYPPAFLVEWDDEKVLFDCSEGVRFRLEQMGYLYTDIHHIAMSHAHPDHNALVNFIHSNACRNSFVGSKNAHIAVYAPEQMVNDFPSVWKAYVPNDSNRESDVWPKLTFYSVSKNIDSDESQNSHKIGSGFLTGFNVFHGHGDVDAVAFRLETSKGIFVYSGDTGDCSEIRAVCKDADLFVCEAASKIGDEEDALAYGHLTPRQAGDIAKGSKVKKLILFHYSGLESQKDIIKDCRSSGYTGELCCAEDFDVHQVSL